MKVKHDIDFYKVYLEQRERQQRAARGGAAALPVLLAAGVVLLGGGYAYLTYLNHGLVQQQNALNNYLYDSEDAQRYQELQSLQSQAGDIRYYNELVSAAQSAVMTRPMLGTKLYEELTPALLGKGTLVGVTQDEDNLVLSVLFDRQGYAADYADALTATGLFRTVTYEEWNTNNSYDRGYYAQLTCMIKEAAQ